MSAMPGVIARLRRVVAARVADTVVDRIVAIVVVIGHGSIPTAVMRLDCVMSPAESGVGARDNYALTSEPEGPDRRRVRVSNARFNHRWSLRKRRRVDDR